MRRTTMIDGWMIDAWTIDGWMTLILTHSLPLLRIKSTVLFIDETRDKRSNGTDQPF
jgi:hypothetical protein